VLVDHNDVVLMVGKPLLHLNSHKKDGIKGRRLGCVRRVSGRKGVVHHLMESVALQRALVAEIVDDVAKLVSSVQVFSNLRDLNQLFLNAVGGCRGKECRSYDYARSKMEEPFYFCYYILAAECLIRLATEDSLSGVLDLVVSLCLLLAFPAFLDCLAVLHLDLSGGLCYRLDAHRVAKAFPKRLHFINYLQ
jgi:hypothetical protein